jgi:hypothetical protein
MNAICKEREVIVRVRDFAASLGLSWADAARVLGVSTASISRWIRALDGVGPNASLPVPWMANAVAAKLDRLDAANAQCNLYANLQELKRADKVAQLKGVLLDPLPQ